MLVLPCWIVEESNVIQMCCTVDIVDYLTCMNVLENPSVILVTNSAGINYLPYVPPYLLQTGLWQ